jgi:threonyl-tRNA synthetase
MRRAGIRVVSDLSDDKLGAKIRKARNMRYPYLAVVGAKEAEQRGLSVRSRDLGEELGFIPLNDMIERIRAEGIPPSRRSG